MFAPMPTSIGAPSPQYLYNKCDKLDPENQANQFVASEGTYKALEEISLAFSPPHATEPPPNPNPLTPQAPPLHSGMHLSVVSLSGSQNTKAIRTPSIGDMPMTERLDGARRLQGEDSSSSNGGDSAGEHTGHSLPTTPGHNSEYHRAGSGSTVGDASASMSASFTANSSIFDQVYDPNAKRKKRVGTSANGTTSSFVSRAISDANLTNRLAEHDSREHFLFANVGRYLSWLDLGAAATVKFEPLSKLMLNFATVVCHDVNQLSRSIDSLDVVLGTSTGDICWYDPVTTRYLRYNKQRCINQSSVTQIQWLPGSDSLFMAAHADGTLVIYDKDREDVDFLSTLSQELEYFPPQEINPAMSILKSAHDTRVKTNPVSCLALSRQTINAFSFSPDQTHLAVVSDDGCMKIIDYRHEKLLDVYSSYYGGLTCVCWSPDGHYIVTGGKDDLVTIWSFVERRIIARCHGHSSFITGVSFDEFMSDDFHYRFGSISEDGKLCLWDFALSSLHKPSSKAARSGALQMPETAHRPVILEPQDRSGVTEVKDGTAYHKVESRLRTAILSPITVKVIDDQPPTHLIFLKDCILTGTTGKKHGRVKTWKRP